MNLGTKQFRLNFTAVSDAWWADYNIFTIVNDPCLQSKSKRKKLRRKKIFSPKNQKTVLNIAEMNIKWLEGRK